MASASIEAAINRCELRLRIEQALHVLEILFR